MDFISLLYFSRLQPSVIHKVLYVMYHKYQGSAVTEPTLFPTLVNTYLRILVILKSVFRNYIKCWYSLFPEILNASNSTTVFLDQSAVFTCETDDGFSGWRINGIRLQNLPPEIRNDVKISVINTPEGSTVETLTIPARAEYNGTTVQCLVVTVGGSSDESENATLKIQGRRDTI